MANGKTSTKGWWQTFVEWKYFPYTLLAFILAVIYFVVHKIKDDKKKKGLKRNNAADAADYAQHTGKSQSEALQSILELQELAENISKAFWGFYTSFGIVGWRWTEDEEEAILNLNLIADLYEAGLVSDYYTAYNDTFPTQTWLSAKKGTSLLADCKKFLSTSQFNSLTSHVKNGIK